MRSVGASLQDHNHLFLQDRYYSFSHYVNQYDDAMRTLNEHISDEQFRMLEKNSV